MIADGDSVARKAFRTALREDTPLPIPLVNLSATDAGATQELDPADILEVKDVAEAIARAQRIVRAPRSQPQDLFESLGAVATDDTAGPASPAPPPSAFPPALAPASSGFPARSPASSPVSTVSLISVGNVNGVSSGGGAASAPEDDAYYHPAGRMRGLADVTLDGYRPEPTLLMRARSRRQSFSLILIAALLPLVVLAAFTIFGRSDLASATTTTSAVTSMATAATVAATATATTTTSGALSSPTVLTVGPMAKATAATKPAAPARPPRAASDGVPVFDVKSLPTARAKR
jgi:hypothetical protein